MLPRTQPANQRVAARVFSLRIDEKWPPVPKTGTGDCEDYAVARYVALREAGVTDDDLRLMIVHDRQVR